MSERDEFRSGDRVEWNAHGGKTTRSGKATGRIAKKLTRTTKIKGHTAKASPDEPQYLVESEKSGTKAAHKPDALRKIED